MLSLNPYYTGIDLHMGKYGFPRSTFLVLILIILE